MKRYVSSSGYPNIIYTNIEEDDRFDYDVIKNIGLKKLQNLYEQQQLLYPDTEIYEYQDLKFDIYVAEAMEYPDENYIIIPFEGIIYLTSGNKEFKIFKTKFKYKADLRTGKVCFNGEYK